MKIPNLSRRRQAGFQAAVFLVILVLVLFVIIIGGVLICAIKSINKIKPMPPPDEHGWVPGLGSLYDGGIVTGFTNSPGGYNVRPRASAPVAVLIYASDDAWPGDDWQHWTNCIWQGPIDQLQTAIGTNGMPMEQWTNGMPPRRFYNFVIQTDQ